MLSGGVMLERRLAPGAASRAWPWKEAPAVLAACRDLESAYPARSFALDAGRLLFVVGGYLADGRHVGRLLILDLGRDAGAAWSHVRPAGPGVINPGEAEHLSVDRSKAILTGSNYGTELHTNDFIDVPVAYVLDLKRGKYAFSARPPAPLGDPPPCTSLFSYESTDFEAPRFTAVGADAVLRVASGATVGVLPGGATALAVDKRWGLVRANANRHGALLLDLTRDVGVLHVWRGPIEAPARPAVIVVPRRAEIARPGDFEWDGDRQEGRARFRFASKRELDWTRFAMDDSAGAEVSGTHADGLLTLVIDVPAPDSYSEEDRLREEQPELWASRVTAILANAEARLEEEFLRRGLISLRREPAFDGPPGQPSIDLRGVESEQARGMPPTQRRVRRAARVLERTEGGYLLDCGQRIDASTRWLHHRTHAPVVPVPLRTGCTYWVTGDGASAETIDVAEVKDAIALLDGAIEGCREMCLDTSVLGKRYRACLLELHDALPCDAPVNALANSLAMIVSHRAGDPSAAGRFRTEVMNQRQRVIADPSALLAIANEILCAWPAAGHFAACPGGATWIRRMPSPREGV
jgi:hypothetical protein